MKANSMRDTWRGKVLIVLCLVWTEKAMLSEHIATVYGTMAVDDSLQCLSYITSASSKKHIQDPAEEMTVVHE